MEIMLSELQQKNVWDGWLGSEIRAHYFADLGGRFQRTQRFITWASLLASSGAAVSVLAALPTEWLWLRSALTIATAALSLWSLVANYSKNATECADLHLRWNRLAIAFETLWSDMYSPDAMDRLDELKQREAELSKSSNTLPNREPMMRKWQTYTVNQHAVS